MSSNQIVSARVVSGPSGLSRVCRRWAKGAFLSALLGTAVMLGLGAAPALAAPANGSGGPSVFSMPMSSDSGTGGPTVFDVTVTPDNGSGGPTVY